MRPLLNVRSQLQIGRWKDQLLKLVLSQTSILICIILLNEHFCLLLTNSNIELFFKVDYIVWHDNTICNYVELCECLWYGQLWVLANSLPLGLDLHKKGLEEHELTRFSSSAITLNKSVNRALDCY